MTAFITALGGDLVSVANVAHVRPVTGRSRLGAIARSELVLADGSTVVGDGSLLGDGGPLADWPQVEGGNHLNPADVIKISGGLAVGRRGQTLGRVINLDRLRKLSGAGREAPEATPAEEARSARHPAGTRKVARAIDMGEDLK